MAAVSILRL